MKNLEDFTKKEIIKLYEEHSDLREKVKAKYIEVELDYVYKMKF
jgi:hypothetical protein